MKTVPLHCALLFLLASCSFAPPEEHARVCRMGGVCASYPARVRVTTKSPGLDFRFFEFHLGRRVILTAYLGDHPDIEHLGRLPGNAQRLGARGTLTSYAEPDGRECLVEISENRAGDRYVHLWYNGLNRAEAKVADAIVDSLHLCAAGERDSVAP